MLRELLSIFRGSNEPLAAMAENFSQMLRLTYENAKLAAMVYFERPATPEERSAIYDKDIAINKLERKIRKQVVAHLSFKGNYVNLPYCLLLITLAKDVERLGDYAKNLSEVREVRSEALPEGEIVEELAEISTQVEASFNETARVLETSDREAALQHIRAGHDIAHRCDALLTKIAGSSYEASATTALVLGARYFKRISGHLTNVLSSVVMPLHKVDYFDESALPDAEQ